MNLGNYRSISQDTPESDGCRQFNPTMLDNGLTSTSHMGNGCESFCYPGRELTPMSHCSHFCSHITPSEHPFFVPSGRMNKKTRKKKRRTSDGSILPFLVRDVWSCCRRHNIKTNPTMVNSQIQGKYRSDFNKFNIRQNFVVFAELRHPAVSALFITRFCLKTSLLPLFNHVRNHLDFPLMDG